MFCALFVWVSIKLRDGRLGRAWMAIREDELAASLMGVPLMRTKLWSYAIGAVAGGVGGAFFATIVGTVDVNTFTFAFSIIVLCAVILGGMGNVWGAILGAVVITWFNYTGLTWIGTKINNAAPAGSWFATFNFINLQYGLFGLVLVLMMLFRPDGFIPAARTKKVKQAELEVLAHQEEELRPAGGGSGMTDLLLDAREVRVQFGGLTAVNDVDFNIPVGSIVALIGPNGAGKTTFFNVLTGLYTPTQGYVEFDGLSILGVPPHKIAAGGMARTFQNIRLFGAMTAAENVMVAMHPHLKSGVASTILVLPKQRHEERDARNTAKELLEFVGIGGTDEEFAKNLPYGDQRRLEVAACAGPAAEAAAARRADGRHEPARVGGVHCVRPPGARRARHHHLADRARHEGGHGHCRAHHRAGVRHQDRRGHPGRDPCRPPSHRGVPRQSSSGRCSMTFTDITPSSARAAGREPMLTVDDIHVFYGNIAAVKGISLTVYPGEIVTLIGGNGAGKSTTMRAISGLIRPKRGEIHFEGNRVSGLKGHEVAARGIAQSPEGRRIFPRMTVTENLELGAYMRNDKAGIAADMERVFDLFPRLKERLAQKSGTLSGGEQQMLAMGRALMAQPRLLLLDEPSMGLAPVLVDVVFDTIRKVNEQGTTVLLVEQNALVALNIADHGYVLETGPHHTRGTGH